MSFASLDNCKTNSKRQLINLKILTLTLTKLHLRPRKTTIVLTVCKNAKGLLKVS